VLLCATKLEMVASPRDVTPSRPSRGASQPPALSPYVPPLSRVRSPVDAAHWLFPGGSGWWLVSGPWERGGGRE
jgi:hypothetical protein